MMSLFKSKAFWITVAVAVLVVEFWPAGTIRRFLPFGK
jgi:hypothetical protein